MEKTTNISLVGVGGQGILLASEIISRTAMLSGLDVKKSEVHGMAQRGGSVVSEVRIGKKVYSPLIPQGETDYLMSFELLESLRYADGLATDGFALINSQTIMPITVSSGQQPWVDDIEERIARAFPRRKMIKAIDIAAGLGNLKVVNVVLTGALSRLIGMEETAWRQSMTELVPKRFQELNLRAFTMGQDLMEAPDSAGL